MIVNGLVPGTIPDFEQGTQTTTDSNNLNSGAEFSALLFLILGLPQVTTTPLQSGLPQSPPSSSSPGCSINSECAASASVPVSQTNNASEKNGIDSGILNQVASEMPTQVNQPVSESGPDASSLSEIGIRQASPNLPAPSDGAQTSFSPAHSVITKTIPDVSPPATPAAEAAVVNAKEASPAQNENLTANNLTAAEPVLRDLAANPIYNKVGDPPPAESEKIDGSVKAPMHRSSSEAHDAMDVSKDSVEGVVRDSAVDLLEKRDLEGNRKKNAFDRHGESPIQSAQTDLAGSVAVSLHNAAGSRNTTNPVSGPIIGKVASEIAVQVRQNKQQAVVTLDPPELGNLRIALTLDGDKVRARIIAEFHESGNLIQSHLPELKEALQIHRLDLVDVQIDSGNWHGATNDMMQSFGGTFAEHGTWGGAGDGNDGQSEPQVATAMQASETKSGRVSMWV